MHLQRMMPLAVLAAIALVNQACRRESIVPPPAPSLMSAPDSSASKPDSTAKKAALAPKADRYPVVGWEHTTFKPPPAPKEPAVAWFLWFGRNAIVDCNGNGINDNVEMEKAPSKDRNENGVLDE